MTNIPVTESDDGPPTGTSELHFSPEDLESFDDDDTEAGKNIGKMLSLFFLYTIVVMSLAAYWTFASIATD